MGRTIVAGALSVLAAALGLLASTPAGAGTNPSPVTPAQARSLGQQAYFYGFPLLEFLRVRQTQTSVRCPDSHGDAPINSFSNLKHFANPSTRTVVAPNVDALYSVAHLDLGKGPVVLRHPDMGKRYFVFQVLDPYTNNVAYIGSRTTGSDSGRFALTWSGHPGRHPAGTKTVRVHSRRVWILGRTLATNRRDRRSALAKMRHYTLTPPGGAKHFAQNCRPGEPDEATTPDGLDFLEKLGRALKHNPPRNRDKPLLDQLATVGVGPGLRPGSAGLSPEALDALVAGVQDIATTLPDGARSTVLATALAHNGWATPPSDIGEYGTDYQTRAGVAVLGLGANTPEEAIYPTAYADSQGQLLDGHNSYRLVFTTSEIPPARAFWSATMYNLSGNLVVNKIQRYSVGSSHKSLVTRANGSVVIRIQRHRPTEHGVNWLPSPKDQFRLNLRLYWPKPSALSGAWQPPPVQRIDSSRR